MELSKGDLGDLISRNFLAYTVYDEQCSEVGTNLILTVCFSLSDFFSKRMGKVFFRAV